MSRQLTGHCQALIGLGPFDFLELGISESIAFETVGSRDGQITLRTPACRHIPCITRRLLPDLVQNLNGEILQFYSG